MKDTASRLYISRHNNESWFGREFEDEFGNDWVKSKRESERTTMLAYTGPKLVQV